MLHAVFLTYACSCKHGCAEKYDECCCDRCGDWNGRLLSLNMYLNRHESFELAIRNGFNVLPDSELRRLGLDLKRILKNLQDARTKKQLNREKTSGDSNSCKQIDIWEIAGMRTTARGSLKDEIIWLCGLLMKEVRRPTVLKTVHFPKREPWKSTPCVYKLVIKQPNTTKVRQYKWR